jgi:hypothetical protein
MLRYLILTLAVCSTALADFDPDLKLHYSFNADTYTASGRLVDLSGYNHDGIRFNSTNWIVSTNGANGTFGALFITNFLSTNGASVYPGSQYIAVTNMSENLTAGAVAFWVQFFDKNTGTGQKVSTLFWSGHRPVFGQLQYTNMFRIGRLQLPDQRQVSMRIWTAANPDGAGQLMLMGPVNSVSSTDTSTTQLDHYVFTWNCTNDTSALYVNGVLFQTNTVQGVPWLRIGGGATDDYLCIGAASQDGTYLWGDDAFPNDHYHNGILDDIRIYSKALSASDVSAIYASTGPAKNNWFVDNTATGANNGTSWNDAWTSPANIVWNTGGVQAGDHVFISGGTTEKSYTNFWSVTANGTADNRITIRVGQADEHKGEVIFDGSPWGDLFPVGQFMFMSRSYITLDGSVNGESRMNFLNLVNTNGLAARNNGWGIVSSSGSENIWRYLTLSNINNGIKPNGKSTIHNCYFRIRGDAAITQLVDGTTWDDHKFYSNQVTVLVKPGGGGPDGFQVRPGTSVYKNQFRAEWVDYYTSGQHPEFVQGLSPRWMKVYGNDFVNYGDAGVTFAPEFGVDGLQDIRIYNNIFRQTVLIDNVPEYIRLLTQDKANNGFYRNIYIVNNLFADGYNTDTTVVSTYRENADAGITGTNNWIANNIWVGCSSGANNPMINLRQINANPSVWTVTNNVYHSPTQGYIAYRETNLTTDAFIAAVDLTGTTDLPTFLSYVANDENNDFRLSPSDTVARDRGISFSDIFTTGKNDNPRLGSWDIGPYETLDEGDPTAPNIVTHPASQTIGEGSIATMTVAASGTATLTYQWYIGTSGTTTSPISGATSSSYTTDSLTSTTQYWVRVTNDQGSDDSNTATITVESSEPPPPATGTIIVNTANVGTISKP